MPSARHNNPLMPWIVVFVSALFFFFEFMQVNMFNALNPSLIKAFQINAKELGNLSANYFYANVLFLFPAGIILDRVSTRKVILIAMSATVTFTLVLSLTTALWQAELARFVTGISGAFCLLSSVRLASRWFPPKHMALVIGLIVTLAMLGGVVAQTPFTILTDHFGWRPVLVGDAVVGALILLLIALVVRDFPPGTEAFFKMEHAALQRLGFWQALKQVARNWQNWLGGIYTSLMNLPIFLLGATWGSLYLVQVRHLTRDQASVVTSMLFVGMIIGSPMIGWVSDKIRRRQLPMIIGSVLALGVILVIMYSQHLSYFSLILLFLLLGFIVAAQIISYPLIAESNPLLLTGAAEGIASVLIMGGGFTIPLFAELMDWDWSHNIVNNLPVYSVQDYRLGFAIMPIAFIIALLASMLIRETRCEAFDESALLSVEGLAEVKELSFEQQ